MAKRALYQVTERTLAVATDILHIGNSNRDYRISFANLCQYIWMYLTGTYFIEQAVKNISSSDQTTNLSIYEAGGASEKPNGWRIKVSWTGGNKTFSHSWTGTTYDFLLPDGTVVDASVFVGYGFGSLEFELDKTNGYWIIINDLSIDFDTVVIGEIVTTRKINGYMKAVARLAKTSSSTITWTYNIAFLAGTEPRTFAIVYGDFGVFPVAITSTNTAGAFKFFVHDGTPWTSTTNFYATAEGKWR